MTANETAGSECPDTEVASQPPLECRVCVQGPVYWQTAALCSTFNMLKLVLMLRVHVTLVL